jgi:hypothetical protein
MVTGKAKTMKISWKNRFKKSCFKSISSCPWALVPLGWIGVGHWVQDSG